MNVQKEQMSEIRSEMIDIYRRACESTPGLEQFNRRKKALLWGFMGIVVLQRVLFVFSMPRMPLVLILLGCLIGLIIPGVIAITAYRGPWKISLIFYLLAALILYDLLRAGLAVLPAGMQYSWIFYATMVLQSVYALYLLVAAIWLTVPAKNRNYAEVTNAANKECSQMMKEKTKEI